MGRKYALAGRRGEALEMLAQLLEVRKREYVSPFAIAGIYAALGDKDQAFVWMNKAIDEREVIVVYLKATRLSDPSFSNLRDDPRFLLVCSASDSVLNTSRKTNTEGFAAKVIFSVREAD